MKILKSNTPSTVGKTMILPFLGKVTFNKNNQVLIEDEGIKSAEQAIDSDTGIELELHEVGDSKESVIEKKTTKPEPEVGNEPKPEVESSNEDPKVLKKATKPKDELDKLTTPALEELLKDYPKADTDKLTSKGLMVTYLRKKLTESAE